VLEIKGLCKRFGAVGAVVDVSLELLAGRVYGLVGPNGSGKTTVLNLISGFYQPDCGQILLRNGGCSRRIDRLPVAARARLGLGRMFQEPRGIAQFTAMENVLLCTLPTGSDNLLAGGLRPFALGQKRDRVASLLSSGGLTSSANCRSADLSYGERRILDYLCLIALGSHLVLLDEPFAGADPSTRQTLTAMIRDQVRRGDTTVLLVSHDIPAVMEIADELILMDGGRIIMQGLPVTVTQSEEYKEAYLR
jgi:ABC-type branched-subunit amino acid transport system ATPase component